MLYSVEGGKEITKIPHQRDFNRWRAKLSNHEYDAIVVELNNRIDGGEVHTSSWIPGSNWQGTVFEPLYHACNRNEKAAAMFFGLILYQVMIDRKEWWAFGRYEKNGVPIEGLTYYRINNP